MMIVRLLQQERPLATYGWLAFCVALMSLALGVPLFFEFFETGHQINGSGNLAYICTLRDVPSTENRAVYNDTTLVAQEGFPAPGIETRLFADFGFAGSTADAFALLERLEAKLEATPGQLQRACVELAKDWRTDRMLRRLEAMMIVADPHESLVLTGTGGVVEVQGTAEEKPFSREQFSGLMDLAHKGVDELVELQKQAIGG